MEPYFFLNGLTKQPKEDSKWQKNKNNLEERTRCLVELFNVLVSNTGA